MCGLGGAYRYTADGSNATDAQLARLRESLRHRGPDGEGEWRSADRRTAFVHTRLAVQDLTPAASQPMSSSDGRFALAYNGEIYNHVELREPLLRKGVVFRSSGDTETLLQLLIHEGEAILPRLNGMFAFAFFDQVKETLLLARDAYGQRPLYFAERAGSVAFASETRALVSAQMASSARDPIAYSALVQKGSIPAPHTHLADVSMLAAGSVVRFGKNGRDGPHEWWNMPWAHPETLIDDFDEAVSVVAPILRDAARRVLTSDVPVGLFLSGGIDSTALCMLFVSLGIKLKSFTVALPGSALDESKHARAVADLFGTEHTEIAVDDQTGRTLVAAANEAGDVPSTDGENTYIVAKYARDAGCIVAVTGIGGDEVFGGYPTFRDALMFRRCFPDRGFRKGLLRFVSADLASVLKRVADDGGKVTRVAAALNAGMDAAALYCARRSISRDDVRRFGFDDVGTEEGAYDYIADVRRRGTSREIDPGNRALDYEQRIYLHDQLLRDADQFGMAHPLEIRAPFLDMDLARATSRIAGHVKAERGIKGLLVAATEQATGMTMPKGIVRRRKQGFTLQRAWRPQVPPKSFH